MEEYKFDPVMYPWQLATLQMLSEAARRRPAKVVAKDRTLTVEQLRAHFPLIYNNPNGSTPLSFGNHAGVTKNYIMQMNLESYLPMFNSMNAGVDDEEI